MNQLKKVIYVVPLCQAVRLEPRESIAQSSPLSVILLTEINGKNAIIDIEHLGYESL